VVSSDVVVLGRETESKRALPFAARLAIDVGLGERFHVSGRGIDGRLTGNLQFRSDPDALPTLTGNIRVVDGFYNAYGRKLSIERGVISFLGPIDNPALDILALRKEQAVEAGVAVTGTVKAPVVRLVSEPNVPDSEKLSWLVLGHGLNEAGSSDLQLLQAALGPLLSRGRPDGGLDSRLAQATGLDEVGIKARGGLENSVIALGKRLSSRLYISYEKGLFAASNAVKLRYTLSPRWSVQTQAGTDSAIDLFFNFSFD